MINKNFKISIFLFSIILLNSCTYASDHSKLKSQCIEILKKGLSSKDETIRLDSIANIEKLKITDPIIKKNFLEIALSDPSEVARAAAIYSLNRLKGKSAIPVFKKALENKGQQAYLIHIAASVALYNSGEKEYLKVIKRYLESKNVNESIEAAMSTSALHNGSIIPFLRAKLDTDNKLLKNTLLLSLAILGEIKFEKEINSLLESNHFNSQMTALNIIGVLKDKRFNIKLKEKLTTDNPLIRIRAAKILSILSGEDNKSVIIEYLLSDKNEYSGYPGEDVRISAIGEGLSEFGDTSDLPLLKKFLTKGGRERIMAAGAIIEILNRMEITTNKEGLKT